VHSVAAPVGAAEAPDAPDTSRFFESGSCGYDTQHSAPTAYDLAAVRIGPRPLAAGNLFERSRHARISSFGFVAFYRPKDCRRRERFVIAL
jgi:hypothetical protein